jgi:hypothetical protein
VSHLSLVTPSDAELAGWEPGPWRAQEAEAPYLYGACGIRAGSRLYAVCRQAGLVL